MKQSLTLAHQSFADSPLWIVGACFCSSLVVLGLFDAPASALVGFVAWTLLAYRFDVPPESTLGRRFLHYAAPCGLCLATLFLHYYVAALLAAGWFCWRAARSDDKYAPVLRHFGYAILLFELVDLMLLKHGMVAIWLNGLAHFYTRLVRDSHGSGEISGFVRLQMRLLVFTIVATAPLTTNLAWQFLLPIAQAAIVVVLISFRWYLSDPWIAAFASLAACGLITLSVPKRAPRAEVGLPSSRWRYRTLQLARTGGAVYVCLLLILGIGSYRSLLPRQTAAIAGEDHPKDPQRASILFVNDHAPGGKEADEQDMTYFENAHNISKVADFDQLRTQPAYDKLACRLLPALGYSVSIKSLEELTPQDYAKYRLVVMICIQNKLPPEHKQALYDSIKSGNTNLMIVGDHTNIRGVREPFNDIMGPLGVELNYDSVFPFGQWYSQLVYHLHPINGPLAIAVKGPDLNYSVGSSLTLDSRVAWPILEAGDGFADEGTPNAPSFAGLGDMVYTENEVRGGLILAAERPLGNGTILAIGDTAFLQNSSVAHNYAYLASLFDYVTRPVSLLAGANFKLFALFLGMVTIAGLLYRFSGTFSAFCVVVILAATTLTTTLQSNRDVIAGVRADLLVIDDQHAERFQSHGVEKGIGVLVSLTDQTAPYLTLVANACDLLDFDRLKCIYLLAPQADFLPTEQQALVDFVARGGRLLYASGYYESDAHPDLLQKMGCKITPMILGAGQQVSVVKKGFPRSPRLSECWQMDLQGDWESVLTCYDKPVLALRNYGKGTACAFSDSFALLDGSMGNDRTVTNADCYAFFQKLFTEFFANR